MGPQISAAGSPAVLRWLAPRSPCFNEAAALCCGSSGIRMVVRLRRRASRDHGSHRESRARHVLDRIARIAASMKPRPSAVDHQRCRRTADGIEGASMRPRLSAVDHCPRSRRSPLPSDASMRPRRSAADHSPHPFPLPAKCLPPHLRALPPSHMRRGLQSKVTPHVTLRNS